MAVDVSVGEFNAALWKRFKGGKIRNVYPLAKYNDIVEKIKTIEKNPPCNTPGEYYLLRKFVVATIDGRERLCCKPENCSVSEKTINGARCDLKFYVALEEIYTCIDEVHKLMVHGGKDRIVRSIQKKGVVNITRETVELYLSFCKVCRPQRRDINRKLKTVNASNRICDSPTNNISSESEGADRFCLVNNIAISETVSPAESRNGEAFFSLNRSYIDLIDFSSTPDGDYRFVLLYLDLQTNFCVLHPIRCKCTYEIVSQLLNVFTLLGPPQVLHSNFDESFMISLISDIKQAWPDLVIVLGTISYLEVQEVAVNCISELHSMLKSWLSENNSHHWSSALKFIQLRRNTALGNGSAKSPYECLFGKSMSSKLLTHIDSSLLKNISKEDDLMTLIHNQSEQCESLQISLDPNICSFVQNDGSQEVSMTDESDRIIASSIIKAEPLSDSENATNGIDLSESSNDACSSPNFGNLEIVIKQEKEDS